MTLTTRIAIVEPTPVKEVFDQCRRIIGAQDARYRHEEPALYWSDGRSEYRNEIGQGYPALLWVYYGVEAPLVADPLYADDPDERKFYPPVDGWSIEVCFDTAYAYRAENGAGCEDLHAWIVQELGRWLTGHGLTWFWCHEFTGEWHDARTPVALLGDPERGQVSTRT